MKDKNEQISVEAICQNLDRESLGLIDFDEIKGSLHQYLSTQKELDHCKSELEYIKNEYRARIYGMLKAVLACRHNTENAEILESLSGELREIDSEKLVKLYHRTAVKFRTCFPGSLRYVISSRRPNNGNWEDFKI